MLTDKKRGESLEEWKKEDKREAGRGTLASIYVLGCIAMATSRYRIPTKGQQSPIILTGPADRLCGHFVD